MNQLADCKSDFSRFRRETLSLLQNDIKPHAALIEQRNNQLNHESETLRTEMNEYNQVLGQNRQVHKTKYVKLYIFLLWVPFFLTYFWY